MALIETITDHQIITLIHENDSSAHPLIYDKYAPLLYGIIYPIVNDQKIAEDVLQDTMIRICKNIRSYNPDKLRFFTWIMNTAFILAKSKVLPGKVVNGQSTNKKNPGILTLIFSNGLSMSEAAERLNISLAEASIKFRNELKRSVSLKS